ncbi:MAG: GNAT family protein [Streptosporangiaceae bacterium]
MFRPEGPAETARPKLVSWENRQGEIGFVSESMLTLGFRAIGWHRIIGSCDTRNQAPARLMERIGMRREARFAHNQIVKGQGLPGSRLPPGLTFPFVGCIGCLLREVPGRERHP